LAQQATSAPLPDLEVLASALGRSDPAADDVMAAFDGLPPGQGFQLLDRALRTDIRAVPEAPRALHALFAELERVPSWVDWPRLDRGGAVVLRAGAAAGIVLGMKSLILGYASPGGNKPLVFSGRLQEQASRRLAETCRFVQACVKLGRVLPQLPATTLYTPQELQVLLAASKKSLTPSPPKP
jgi:hypothetical protein